MEQTALARSPGLRPAGQYRPGLAASRTRNRTLVPGRHIQVLRQRQPPPAVSGIRTTTTPATAGDHQTRRATVTSGRLAAALYPGPQAVRTHRETPPPPRQPGRTRRPPSPPMTTRRAANGLSHRLRVARKASAGDRLTCWRAAPAPARPGSWRLSDLLSWRLATSPSHRTTLCDRHVRSVRKCRQPSPPTWRQPLVAPPRAQQADDSWRGPASFSAQ